MTKKHKRLLYIAIACASAAVLAIIIIKYVLSHRPFVFAGTLETTKIILAARVPSDISAVYVNEGDIVKSGDTLMELSCDTYKILASQIDKDYERATTLLGKGHLSQADYDMILRTKQDNDLKLNWCKIKSPIGGMIITKFREIGEIVAPGAALISVSNPYDVWAYFYVPYEMLHKLRIGAIVIGTLAEAPDMKFPGQIIKISAQAEFTPKNVQTREERTRLVYGVKVRFENPELILKSGMTIESTLLND